jgi:hypothetical protein
MTKQELLKTAKPILFSTEMVRAILDGRKTQTRRVIKPQFTDSNLLGKDYRFYGKASKDANKIDIGISWNKSDPIPKSIIRKAKYKPGDILYVWETWNVCECEDICPGIADENECPFNRVGYKCYRYKAQYSDCESRKWKPSARMPKEAARIFLRVTDVRAERLQDISENDCLREGIQQNTVRSLRGVPSFQIYGMSEWYTKAKYAFTDLWDRMNAKNGYFWESNPWVWVYTFERVEA